MGVLIVIFSLLLAAFVVMLITGPLRAAQPLEGSQDERDEQQATAERENRDQADRSELEAAREAKYREIRDAELDFRTSKLSESDYAAIDGQLRAEALDILTELESLGGAEPLDDPPAEQAES